MKLFERLLPHLAWLQAYLTLDVIARLVLTSTCRASHVRLPTATLMALLDEQPLARGAVSSSLLQVCWRSMCGCVLLLPREHACLALLSSLLLYGS